MWAQAGKCVKKPQPTQGFAPMLVDILNNFGVSFDRHDSFALALPLSHVVVQFLFAKPAHIRGRGRGDEQKSTLGNPESRVRARCSLSI